MATTGALSNRCTPSMHPETELEIIQRLVDLKRQLEAIERKLDKMAPPDESTGPSPGYLRD